MEAPPDLVLVDRRVAREDERELIHWMRSRFPVSEGAGGALHGARWRIGGGHLHRRPQGGIRRSARADHRTGHLRNALIEGRRFQYWLDPKAVPWSSTRAVFRGDQ